jgi:hypothetical protein
VGIDFQRLFKLGTGRLITLRRRTVQSCVEISPFSLDKSGFPSVINSRYRNYRVRDRLKDEVRKLVGHQS